MSYRKVAMEVMRDGPVTSALFSERAGITQRVASAVLCRMYREGRINRSAEQVRGSARGAWQYERKQPRGWTTSELAALRAMGEVRVSTAARRLGRSERSVKAQAHRHCIRLGGGRGKQWTPRDGVQVAKLLAAGLTKKRIAAQTGIPFATVQRWLA